MATVDADSPCPKCGGGRIRYEKKKGGYTHPVCKPCAAVKARERYQANPAAAVARVQEYYQANAELVKAKRRADYHNDPEAHRAQSRAYYEANREEVKRKARVHYHLNAERYREASRLWREANPERQKELTARWRDVNKDRVKAYNQKYYADNRESEIARCLAYIKAHPEINRAINGRRRARQADAICEHGPKCVSQEFLAMIRASDCVYCGESGKAGHADHFAPLSRGGLHCVENIVPACVSCNTSKHAMDPYDWLAGLTRSVS